MNAGPGVATSDELLDIGSVGLRFFEVYLPLYAQLWDPGTMSLGRARQRYDEQRDLSFAQLCEDADVVAAAAQRLESEQTAMRAAARALRDAWRGAAGISVGAHVGEVLGATTRAVEHLVDTAAVLRRGSEELEHHVRAKADDIATLSEVLIDGRTAAELADIIATAKSGDLSSPRLPELTDTDRPRANDLCRRYLEVTFRPVVDSTWAWFDAVCTRTDTAVRLTYEVLSDVLAGEGPGPVRAATATPAQQPAAQMRAASAGAGWFEPEGPQLASASPPPEGAAATAADWLAGQDRTDSGAALASAVENAPGAPSVTTDPVAGWAGAPGWFAGAVPVGDASDDHAPRLPIDITDAADPGADSDNKASTSQQGLWAGTAAPSIPPAPGARPATDSRGTR